MPASIRFKPANFVRSLSHIVESQMPYAAALALTRTAKDGQASVLSALPTKFTLRTSWTAKGIRVTPARKADGLDGMAAHVGSKDWFMADQMGTEANTRKPRGKYRLIPKRARPSKTSLIPKRLQPKQVFADKRTVVTKSKFGGIAVFTQRGKHGLSLLYAGRTTQVVKPRLDFRGKVMDTARLRFGENFRRAMDEAKRTAR